MTTMPASARMSSYTVNVYLVPAAAASPPAAFAAASLLPLIWLSFAIGLRAPPAVSGTASPNNS